MVKIKTITIDKHAGRLFKENIQGKCASGINIIQITKIDDIVMFIWTPCIYIKQKYAAMFWKEQNKC